MTDFTKPSVLKITDAYYSNNTKLSQGCYCDGKCFKLGYCPRAETKQEAISRLKAEIKKIEQSN